VTIIIFSLTEAVSAGSLVRKDADSSRPELGVSNAAGLFSLFDPNKFQMRHSYSVSYFSSGGRGQTIAMYLNEIEYQLAEPLTLQMKVGWVHQPQSLIGAGRATSLQSQVLPSFRLDWRPSKNFHLRFSYESFYPYSYDSYYRYRNERRFERLTDDP
jgi:hypothetical protein